MQSPKDLFLKKEDLRGQLSSTVSADWFQDCVCYTVAQMHHERPLTAEQMQGVTMFLQTFREMHQKDEAFQEAISTGLQPVKHPTR